MPKSGSRKVVKPVAAAAVTLGTIASIWWFALKPRRRARNEQGITTERALSPGGLAGLAAPPPDPALIPPAATPPPAPAGTR